MFYQKLRGTKIADLFKKSIFAFFTFFRISHIIVKKNEFWIFNSIIYIKKKNIHLMKKCFNSNL